MLVHERGQFVEHRAHAAVADLHDVGANLHGVATQQNELRRVASRLDAADPRQRPAREFGVDQGGDLHAHAQSDRQNRLAGVTPRRRVPLDRRLGPQGFQVNADDATYGVDGADPLTAGPQRGARRVLDVSDVRRHLGPHGDLGRTHDPAAHFREYLRVLPHGRAHAPLGQAVRTREVALQRVHPDFLTALHDLDPCVLAVLLHDRGDQDAVRVFVFDLLELLKPRPERPVAD